MRGRQSATASGSNCLGDATLQHSVARVSEWRSRLQSIRFSSAKSNWPVLSRICDFLCYQYTQIHSTFKGHTKYSTESRGASVCEVVEVAEVGGGSVDRRREIVSGDSFLFSLFIFYCFQSKSRREGVPMTSESWEASVYFHFTTLRRKQVRGKLVKTL